MVKMRENTKQKTFFGRRRDKKSGIIMVQYTTHCAVATVDKNDKKLPEKQRDSCEETNLFNAVQKFLDDNIRIVKNVSWVIGGIGVIVIIRRTYALHHFTSLSAIPENYFKNNVTLTGKVLNVHGDGQLGVQHIPLLWQARLKWITEPNSKLLCVKVTGVEVQNGGVEYLTTLLKNATIKFKLLGSDNCKNIESIIYKKKGWFRKICVNDDIIRSGFGVAHHFPSLSHIEDYNKLIERLVKVEVKAAKEGVGIWKDEPQTGLLYRTWYWFKTKLFKT